jgi:hypothetical protein
MNASAQVAQFLWIGGSLSLMEQLCLRSFLVHGYQVHLYTYGPVSGVPAGVSVLDGTEILPAERVFAYKNGWGRGSYAGFADLFRYHLLFQRGGWWFDTDFVSIHALPAPTSLWLASSFEGTAGTMANCCAMYAPTPGNPAVAWLRDAAERELATVPDIGFGQIGPYLLQKLVLEQGLERHVAPWFEFSPYPQAQIARVAYQGNRAWLIERLRFLKYLLRQAHDPAFRAGYIRKGTRAMHLHNELWSAAGRDKNARYHPRCLFERMKRRHGL